MQCSFSEVRMVFLTPHYYSCSVCSVCWSFKLCVDGHHYGFGFQYFNLLASSSSFCPQTRHGLNQRCTNRSMLRCWLMSFSPRETELMHFLSQGKKKTIRKLYFRAEDLSFNLRGHLKRSLLSIIFAASYSEPSLVWSNYVLIKVLAEGSG